MITKRKQGNEMYRIIRSIVAVLLPGLLLGWSDTNTAQEARLVLGKTSVVVAPARWNATQSPNFEFLVGVPPAPMVHWLNKQLAGEATPAAGSVQNCAREPAAIWDYRGGVIERVITPDFAAKSKSRVHFVFALGLPELAPRSGVCEGASVKSIALIASSFKTFTSMPALSKIHRVSPLTISFPYRQLKPTRSRIEANRYPEVAGPVFSPITFGAHGNQDEVKEAFEYFDKVGRGGQALETITVSVTDSEYRTLLVIELQNLTLTNYSPFGSLDVDDPTTANFEFTVVPGNVKISY